MNPLEKETLSRLKEVGLDFSQYLNPVGYIPPTLIGLTSDILDEAGDDVQEEDEEE